MSAHHKLGFENKKGLLVEVRNNNIEGAIRTLNRKVKQEGLLREVRRRQYYEPPSVVKRREKAEAVTRARRAKQAIE
jgi:small subunit ribosomal protein S21